MASSKGFNDVAVAKLYTTTAKWDIYPVEKSAALHTQKVRVYQHWISGKKTAEVEREGASTKCTAQLTADQYASVTVNMRGKSSIAVAKKEGKSIAAEGQ